MAEYSSWPAVSRTSSNATSSSITHCLRYESVHKEIRWTRWTDKASDWQHTLNRWVVLVDEMALDQLNRETRFSDTTSTNDHQLVFSQELLTTIRQLDPHATMEKARDMAVSRVQGRESV